MRKLHLEPLHPTDCSKPDFASEVIQRAANGKSVEEYVRVVIVAQHALYERTEAVFPWIGYWAQDDQTGELVGSCSFILGDLDKSIEIAYFTFPPFEGRGVATAMASELLSLAADGDAPALYAFTLPEENASARILRKLDFERVADAFDDDAGKVWRWERQRPVRKGR